MLCTYTPTDYQRRVILILGASECSLSLIAQCHYSLHIGYYDDSVAIQDSVEFSPFQVLWRASCVGNPMFPLRWSCDAFRFSVHPLPPYICGCSGTLIGCVSLPFTTGSPQFPCPVPDELASIAMRAGPSDSALGWSSSIIAFTMCILP